MCPQQNVKISFPGQFSRTGMYRPTLFSSTAEVFETVSIDAMKMKMINLNLISLILQKNYSGIYCGD